MSWQWSSSTRIGIVKRLKDARFTNAQAETVTDIIAETRATDLAEVATKANSPCCAATWLVPPMLGQTGLIAASIKLLS